MTDIVNVEPCADRSGWWVAEIEFEQDTSWAGRLLRGLLGHEEPDPYVRTLFSSGVNWDYADTGTRPQFDLNHSLNREIERLKTIAQARSVGL